MSSDSGRFEGELDDSELLNNERNVDEDESDYDEDIDCIDVGLIDESPKSKMHNLSLNCSAFFPCKLGGKPQWLALENVPTIEKDLVCEHCTKPLKFLLQIYAPLNDEDDSEEIKDECFHRTLFLFICTNPICVTIKKNTVKVYRSQMRRDNDIYSIEPPPHVEDDQEEIFAFVFDFYKKVFDRNLNKFCNICGLPCSKKCAKCKCVFYCSEEHQRLDWTHFKHKEICAKYNLSDLPDHKVNLFIQTENEHDRSEYKCLFPEREILIEPEVVGDEKIELDKDGN